MTRLLGSLFIFGLTVSILSGPSGASGQSLAQAAKKEKERREKVGDASRVINETALTQGEMQTLPEPEESSATQLNREERAKCQEQYDAAQSSLETDRAAFDQGFPVGAAASRQDSPGTADYVSCKAILNAKNAYLAEARQCETLRVGIEREEKNLAAAGHCLGKDPAKEAAKNK